MTPFSALVTRRPPSAGRRHGLPVAVALLIIGLTISVLGGLMVRSQTEQDGTRAFRGTARNVTATVTSLLARDIDFVSTLRSVLTMDPHLSPTRFDVWYRLLQGRHHQAGAIGSAAVLVVPAAQIGSFQARRNADTAFLLFTRGQLAPIARARHGYECLLSAGSAPAPIPVLAAKLTQVDWCAANPPLGAYEAPMLAAATENGRCASRGSRVRVSRRP